MSLRGRPAIFLVLATLSSTRGFAQEAEAQPAADDGTRAELARMRDEAIALDEAGRYALAAERYLALHDAMRRAGLPRAPVALWNAGLALTHLPGRERDARDTLQRFLDESTPLTEDAQIRDWRSTALEHIAELDARIGNEAGPAPSEPLANPASPPAASESVSPVGPILLASGGAALLVGAILGGVTLAQDSTLTSMCPGGSCALGAESFAHEVAALALSTDLLLIGGGVLAATGLLLTLVLRDSHPAMTPAASCGPEGCQLQLRGMF